MLFVHGWGGSQQSDLARSRQITALGCVCLTFNLRGHAETEPQHETVTRENNQRRTRSRLFAYDAAILDLGLPDEDGLAVLDELRRNGTIMLVLVLTARDAVEDRVAGLEPVADDYLVKPFAVAEVIARVRALLRRPGHALGTTLQAGNVVFDTIGRDVRVGQAVLPLPRQELAILEHLMRRLGVVRPEEWSAAATLPAVPRSLASAVALPLLSG